jgi:hypothetical protein
MGEAKNVYKLLVRKPKDQKPLNRARYRRDDLEEGGRVWTEIIWLITGASCGLL